MLMTKALLSVVNDRYSTPGEILAYIKPRVDFYSHQYKQGLEIGGTIATVLGVYNRIDENARISDNKDMTRVQCRRGCSFCCHIDVTITEHEAECILEFCKDNNIDISKTYLKNQSKIDPTSQAKSAYPSCVFLKNNECTIYDVRPMACRKYLVVSSPKLCDATKPSTNVEVIIELQTEFLMTAILSIVRSGSMAKMLLEKMRTID